MPASSASAIRPPAVAGMFYDDDSRELRASVDALLGAARPERPNGDIVGIIVPHAGHVYSGLTAAHAYSLLRGQAFDTVLAVGPSHRDSFDGVSVYPGMAYATPLGEVPVDDGLRSALAASGVLVSAAGHRQEHSLEVQLPFLQRALGPFSFVPLIMGSQHPDVCRSLASAIAGAVRGKRVLLLASSDLSHFHPAADAESMDGEVARLIGSYALDELLARLEADEVEACGGGPIVAVMSAARALGSVRATVLHACHSGDVTGDRGSVVGYLSAVLTKEA